MLVFMGRGAVIVCFFIDKMMSAEPVPPPPPIHQLVIQCCKTFLSFISVYLHMHMYMPDKQKKCNQFIK